MSSQRLLLRDSDEDISASDHIRQQSNLIVFVGDFCDLSLGLVHVVGPSSVNRSCRIAKNDILYSERKEQFSNGDACCSRAVDQDLTVSQIFLNYLSGIDKTSKRDDCGSMLIIVEDGQHLKAIESFFNIEAFWSFDVFEIDGVEVAQQFDDGLD